MMEAKTPERKEQNPAHHAAQPHHAAHPHHDVQSHLDVKKYPTHHEAPAAQAPAQTAHRAKGKAFSDYLQSFRELKSFDALMIILYDVGFFALLLLSLYLFSYLLGIIAAPFKGLDATTLTKQSADQLSMFQSSLVSVIVFMILLAIAFFLVFVLLWSVSRGLIWTRLLGKKYDLKYLWKSYFLNMIWMLIWGVVFAALLLGLYFSATDNIAISAVFLVMSLLLGLAAIYFSYMLYYTFTHELLIFRAIKDAFKKGALKFPKLALPLLLVIGTFIVAWFVGYLLNFMDYIPYAGSILKEVIAYVLFFGFFAWAKVYSIMGLKQI